MWRLLCISWLLAAVVALRLLDVQMTEGAVVVSPKYRPVGVDFFEHEFTSVSVDEYDKYGPHTDDDEMGVDDPETMPRLFQGDIAIDPYASILMRLGVNPMKHPKRLWPNATIPFEISPLYKTEERQAIVRALKTFNALTCVKFTPYDGEGDDYLLIAPPVEGPKGCWSYVGKRGGEQVVSLQRPDETSPHCFSSEGRLQHELMHAIGIYHEQSRADRDNYVKIHWENIVPKFRKNFKLISRKRAKYAFEYDYNSVMHYGEFYFSKKKGDMPTMTPLQPGIRIGQRKTISKTDCLKINELYGCLKGRRAKMFKAFCHLLGL